MLAGRQILIVTKRGVVAYSKLIFAQGSQKFLKEIWQRELEILKKEVSFTMGQSFL